MQQTKGSIVGTHILLTGPITGTVTLDDGSEIDVSPEGIEVAHLSAEQVEELAHRVGMHYFENGHPADIEDDPEVGLVQRPFEYVPPARFAHELHGKKPKGTVHKGRAAEHKKYLDTHTKPQQKKD